MMDMQDADNERCCEAGLTNFFNWTIYFFHRKTFLDYRADLIIHIPNPSRDGDFHRL